jgi:glutaredoxin 3
MSQIDIVKPEAVVWSRVNKCNYCDKAVQLLIKKGIKYEIRKIGDGYTADDLRKDVPDATTVPQIFLGGLYVGGYSELLELIGDGFDSTGE